MIGCMDDIGRNVKPTVIDYTANGKCSGCGSCCADYLPLSKAEMERIRAFVKKHGLKEHTAKVLQGQFMDMTCPFRDNIKHRCDIYAVRPEICRCFKCDQEMETINANKVRLYQKNRLISMRGEFFGNVRSKRMADMVAIVLQKDKEVTP